MIESIVFMPAMDAVDGVAGAQLCLYADPG
jgi:hypothetical protein